MDNNQVSIDEVASISFEKDLTVFRLKKVVGQLQGENEKLRGENAKLKLAQKTPDEGAGADG